MCVFGVLASAGPLAIIVKARHILGCSHDGAGLSVNARAIQHAPLVLGVLGQIRITEMRRLDGPLAFMRACAATSEAKRFQCG